MVRVTDGDSDSSKASNSGTSEAVDSDSDDSFEAEVTEQYDHSGDTFAHVEERDGQRSGWVELN